ncbi:MAG: sigma-E processing peptidase SpoIIGA, partial [Clostridia bacterium]|nr:sigma-E processing peptidase SpoIIGA [Clostridia bacterium]
VLYLAVFLLLSGAIFTFELVFFDSGGILILSFVKSQISAFLAFLFLYSYVRARNKRAKEAFCCDCSVTLEGKKVPFRAYVDTGNFLTDPVSGRAVVILEFSLLRNAFGGEFPEPMTYEFSARFANRAKMIPYYSVSGEGKMLSAFLPESFTVNEIPRSVVVAVSDRPLECRGRFQGIIGPSLIGGNEL